MQKSSINNDIPAIGNVLLAVRAKKPTKNQIIDQLIGIAHELDWAYFWKDAKRNKIANEALEEVKNIVKWHERHDR